MLRRIRALLLMSAVASLTSKEVSGQPANLVPNPGFETAGASSGDAASWTEGTGHTRSNDRFHGGGWAMKGNLNGAAGTASRATITVSPNTTYQLTVWIYKSATNAGAGSCVDMNDIPGELQLCATQTNVWQQRSGTWSSGSATSIVLRLVTDGTPNGPSWFDDLSLVAQTTTPSVVVAAAGDIACGAGSGSAACQQVATSDLLVALDPQVVLPLGDNQYEAGALGDFQSFYHPSWGRLKSRTRPAVGNHEYLTAGAQGYFDYFNGVGNSSGPAGDRNKGY
jgi:hypothetical protein